MVSGHYDHRLYSFAPVLPNNTPTGLYHCYPVDMNLNPQLLFSVLSAAVGYLLLKIYDNLALCQCLLAVQGKGQDSAAMIFTFECFDKSKCKHYSLASWYGQTISEGVMPLHDTLDYSYQVSALSLWSHPISWVIAQSSSSADNNWHIIVHWVLVNDRTIVDYLRKPPCPL